MERHSVPDSVLIPRITTLRETVAAYKEFPVHSGGRQTLIFGLMTRHSSTVFFPLGLDDGRRDQENLKETLEHTCVGNSIGLFGDPGMPKIGITPRKPTD